MLLKYETAIATFAQFIVITLLNVINGVDSIVRVCRADSEDCYANTFATFVYILLILLWFGFIWVLGFAAQDRRSKRLAQALIAAEVLVLIVASFNAEHGTMQLGRITSIINILFALWVIVLAFRLMRSKGGRVVSSKRARARRRKYTTTDL